MIMSEMRNALNGKHSRLDEAEEKITELEGVAIKTIQNETQRKKKHKKKERAPGSGTVIPSSLIYG